MPKSARAKGRLAGIGELHQRLLSISRSQARHDKRVKLQVIYRTDGRGRVMEIGSKSGYHASDILSDVRDLHGGDMTSWILSQSRERYENLDLKKSPLVSVTMTVFNAVRTKPARKAQDAAGTQPAPPTLNRPHHPAKGQPCRTAPDSTGQYGAGHREGRSPPVGPGCGCALAAGPCHGPVAGARMISCLQKRNLHMRGASRCVMGGAGREE
ncbi:hypothetical protein [Arthrobacter sp. CJ23]|uniref:hypothetical protein n=1 Tax=Arthrobacter sp. CJ23 TaxID=2972479 RepID=UPI00215C289F|nr:hypothetical protein [Arthrobacter sp. CJ23]UVJ37798.1 hypothetical protein NVV90_10925 [Arthrobacter sp. CJ23]